MKTTYSTLILAAVVVAGCSKPPASPVVGGDRSSSVPLAETAATDKPTADAEGVTVQIKDYDSILKLLESKRGKVVVMDCWSTFCGPCMKEFPGLVELQKQYGSEVACVSLSFNYEGAKNETPEEHQEQVLDFLRQQQATFDNILAAMPSETLYKKLGFKSASVPAIFVYDREGNVARQFEGPDAKYSAVGKLVDELVGGAK